MKTTTPAPKRRPNRKRRITPIMEKVLHLLGFGPQSTIQIAVDLKVNSYDLWRWLKILEKVGRIERCGKSMSGFQGRPPHVWRLKAAKP